MFKNLLVIVMGVILFAFIAEAQDAPKRPDLSNRVVILTSDYGCEAGWQNGKLASDVAALVRLGFKAENILCLDAKKAEVTIKK